MSNTWTILTTTDVEKDRLLSHYLFGALKGNQEYVDGLKNNNIINFGGSIKQKISTTTYNRYFWPDVTESYWPFRLLDKSTYNPVIFYFPYYKSIHTSKIIVNIDLKINGSYTNTTNLVVRVNSYLTDTPTTKFLDGEDNSFISSSTPLVFDMDNEDIEGWATIDIYLRASSSMPGAAPFDVEIHSLKVDMG